MAKFLDIGDLFTNAANFSSCLKAHHIRSINGSLNTMQLNIVVQLPPGYVANHQTLQLVNLHMESKSNQLADLSR